MSKLYVMLGALGDICGILPMLHADAQAGERPKLMVSSQYAPHLDGCSYVDVVPFDGPHSEIEKACEQAKSVNGEFRCLQIKGPREQVEKWTWAPAGLKPEDNLITPSYEMDAWRVAGRLNDWAKGWPLVFDRRDKFREEELVQRMLPKTKKKTPTPFILVAADGISSPFPYKHLLLELLNGRFKKTHRIIELPQAERFYDLLGLYERAYCLVAVDSAPLHLARACPSLPVVALANDKPMLCNGSAYRPNHIWYCRYSDFPERAVQMLDRIEDIPKIRTSKPMVIHVWNAYGFKRTVDFGLRWQPLPIEKGMCGRDSENALRDTKRLPYLRDCLQIAMHQIGAEYVVLSRPDVGFVDAAPGLILSHDACYAYRLARTDVGETFVPVQDFFCARVEWWRAHFKEIPDFLLGGDHHWSQGLWAIFQKHGAADLTGICYKLWSKPAPTDANAPRITHNFALCTQALADNGIQARYPKVTDQIECLPLNTEAMHPGGYNPSIIEDKDGKIQIAYRYHETTLATKLALAEIDETAMAVIDNQLIELPGKSTEDPKLFIHRWQIWLSWVESLFPDSINSIVKVRRLKDNLAIQPPIGKNNWSGREKNWLFFDHQGEIWCLYQSTPKQQCYGMADNGQWEKLSECPGPTWAYGEPRGGCFIPWDGKILRFFHSQLRNEYASVPHRYFLGACLMEPDPPFKVLKTLRKPIAYGSEIDSLKVSQRPFHHKRNVIFPGSGIMRDGAIWLPLGINDCISAIALIKPQELNL